ncbi:L-threonine 3-dehydrogenase, partial [Eubacteriales bacterium OttesenSCG-928-N14]|nr:L-threonine 3-dehydrogenase [Eubacteriales bacterium OttesenSCG-928-N14]
MMDALVKEQPGASLALKQVPMPKMGVGDVLIRVLKTAICGTDMHIYNWDAWSERTIQTPMVIGHEFVGEIIAMDDHACGYRVGDIVSGEGHIVCKTCRNCMAGRRHLCKHTIGVGVNRQGAFAQYLSLPYENVVRLEKGIDLDVAACFDPLGNAVHTALKFDLVGEDVLITGAGPIGIMAAAICRHCGAKNVVITDMNEYRLDLASKTTQLTTLNVSKQSISDVMKDLGMREGFDIGLEMSGSEPAFASMIEHMNSGGKVALLGIHSGETRINWDKVVFNGLTIQGIYGR